MLRSMTGYGRGESILHGRRFVVEIKSVNHRYADINIRLPRSLNPFEDRLRKKIASKMARGKVDVYISMESFAGEDIKITLNESIADAYAVELRRAVERYGFDDNCLSLIMSFPDVLTVDKTVGLSAPEQLSEGMDVALEMALEAFIAMREMEGEELKRDLKSKLSGIQGLTQQLAVRMPCLAKEYAARLRDKLTEVLASAVDENRILSEAVIFAERCCVDEELTRLNSHLKQFEAILESDTAVGRKLDFIMQEMNREINTIGSKASDLEITQLVIELKSELEKVREQIQNIE